MTIDVNDILRRPLYGQQNSNSSVHTKADYSVRIVFALPHELLVTLHRRDPVPLSTPLTPSTIPAPRDGTPLRQDNKDEGTIATSTSCALCDVKFSNLLEQRSHVRSDFHNYNLKQRLKGLRTVNEAEFEKLVGGMAAQPHSSIDLADIEDRLGREHFWLRFRLGHRR